MNTKDLIGGFAVLVVGGLAFPSFALAAVITFGNSAIDRLDLVGTQTEGVFSYTASGDGWELQTLFGNPGASLTTFFNTQDADVGDTVDITRTGGGQFTFDSVDWRTITGSNSDDLVMEGFLSGGLVASLVLSGSSTTWVAAGGFGGPVDLLRVRVTGDGANAMLLDNVTLTVPASAVPEPAGLALMALGLAGIGFRRKHAR